MARVSLSDVASSILDASLPDGVPILSRRKGIEKKLAEAKAAEREQAAVAKAKRALAEQPHQSLRGMAAEGITSDASLETELRKIATRGVVQLFNAVRAAQKDDGEETSGRKAKRARREASAREGVQESSRQAAVTPTDLSRDSFLDLLRRGTAAASKPSSKPAVVDPAASGGAAGDGGDGTGASFLRDNFMLGRNRARDWERDMEETELDGYVDDDAQGADDEDDDDGL